jgi:hypothetical protein
MASIVVSMGAVLFVLHFLLAAVAGQKLGSAFECVV